MRYVIDTHTLVWYLTGDTRLSKKIRNILKGAEQGREEIIVPAIVLLEAIDIQEKKKVRFEIKDLFDFLEIKENFQIADLNLLLVKQIPGLAAGLDLHDRVVIAVGKIYKGIILSRDAEIKKFIETIW